MSLLFNNNNENIKVYAFVGPSGTGKSYRAQMVASENNINYIILCFNFSANKCTFICHYIFHKIFEHILANFFLPFHIG